MTKYIKLGAANDPIEVEKLEEFLENFEGFINLNEQGIYDQAMFNAVLQFQTKYGQDILAPWGISNATGWVYTATVAEINKIYCSKTAVAPTPIAPATPTTQTTDELISELTAKIAALKAQLAELLAQQAVTTTPTAPITLTCAPYMTKYIKLGAVNDTTEVNKLQNFLIVYEGDANLSVTGIYDQATYNAVLQFQTKYASDILAPWGFAKPTGYVQRTTVAEINKIYCAEQAKNK